MKLSTLTGTYMRKYIPDECEALEYLASLGYRTFDYTLYDDALSIRRGDDYLSEAKKVKATMKKLGATFCQAHAPSSLLRDTSGELLKKLRRSIELSEYLEIPYLVIHFFNAPGLPAEEQYRQNAEFYSELYPLLEKSGVSLCIENIGDFTQDLHLSSAEELLSAVKVMGHKSIFVCWDTGHGNITNQEQYGSITKLGDLLRCVHIHDNYYPISKPGKQYAFDAHNFPLFGNVNFDAVVQGLIDIGFKNAFSLETDTPNRRGHLDFKKDGCEEQILRLKPIPFEIRRDSDIMLYKIGKYILETYGIFEG